MRAILVRESTPNSRGRACVFFWKGVPNSQGSAYWRGRASFAVGSPARPQSRISGKAAVGSPAFAVAILRPGPSLESLARQQSAVRPGRSLESLARSQRFSIARGARIPLILNQPAQRRQGRSEKLYPRRCVFFSKHPHTFPYVLPQSGVTPVSSPPTSPKADDFGLKSWPEPECPYSCGHVPPQPPRRQTTSV